MKLKIILILVCASLFLQHVIKMYIADVEYKRARNSVENGRFEQAYKYIQKAIENNSLEASYYRERARVYIGMQLGQNTDTVNALKDLAFADLQKSINLNPNNLASIRNALPYFYFLAIKDTNKPADPNNLDEKYLRIAQDFFIENELKYSTDVGTLVDIATYEKKLFLTRNYEETRELIKQLRPDILEWVDVLK